MTNPEMTELEQASINDLIDELGKRCVAGVLAIAYTDGQDGDTFQTKQWGSMMWRRGTLDTLSDRAYQDAKEFMRQDEVSDD